ncbi:MAG TPA: hypothetical protein VMB50_22320 [Myxococcales bacterium]|nr:hypothetical protein [Myxococcales bacterium]
MESIKLVGKRAAATCVVATIAFTYLSCAVTTEADTASEEQRAYGRCLDACRTDPAEMNEAPDDAALRMCQADCNAEYPQDDWQDDARDNAMGADAHPGPHPVPPPVAAE